MNVELIFLLNALDYFLLMLLNLLIIKMFSFYLTVYVKSFVKLKQ